LSTFQSSHKLARYRFEDISSVAYLLEPSSNSPFSKQKCFQSQGSGPPAIAESQNLDGDEIGGLQIQSLHLTATGVGKMAISANTQIKELFHESTSRSATPPGSSGTHNSSRELETCCWRQRRHEENFSHQTTVKL
jgi:hypothetical protein